ELDEEEPFHDEVQEAPLSLEDGGQVTVDELKEFNLGTSEDPRPINHIINCYLIKPGTRPIKQTQRHFSPKLLGQIEAEVDKLIVVEFIREVKYPTWISNIVRVKKKTTGQIHICVDF
ncbi:unnamed protein product, partial [Prunus brigantina]